MNILKKELKFEKKYLVLFVIFNFLILGIYYTYSIFVVKQIKEDISLISVRSNVLTMTSTNLSNNGITVPANTSSNITINITNSTSSSMYYRIIHEGVPTGVAVYETNNEKTYVGSINGNATINSQISINNTTENPVTVVFKCQESTEETFDIPFGYSYVNRKMNFDHSGAFVSDYEGWTDIMDHFDNFIPVYYDESTGVWKKANQYNFDSEHIWHDYDNFRWANVVTVSATNREMYLSAEPGTTVSDSDINAFFVYIPRYKYYIVSGNGNTSFEKTINVVFANYNLMDDQMYSPEGTVGCYEAISNEEDKHLYSEICNDETYGSIYNNLSTYVHPAFGGDSNDGFWVGKFANSNTSTIYIKPNTQISSSTNFSVSNVRKMTKEGNIYGFESSGTTFNENDWGYNDNLGFQCNINTLPITSMDWGAVAILASSQYGKSGNPMYQTDTLKSFTRIYNNTSSTYSGRSTNYTTSSTSISNSSTSTVYYNDLTDVTHTSGDITYPIGYKGAGASTTGTIYGVYDMAGGNNTTVMGIMMKEDGTTDYQMDSDFYTAYSYVPYEGFVDDASKAAYLETFRLGDGIKEHVRTFSPNGMWQDGTLTLKPNSYMYRGGVTTNGSLFTTEFTNENKTLSTFTIAKKIYCDN